MKILVIRNSFSYDFGGAERLAVHLADVLIKAGIDALVFSSQSKLLEYAKSENVPSAKALWWSRQNWSSWRIFLTPLYFLWQIILFIWYVFKILQIKPTALHILSKDDFIAATLAAKAFRKKVVWTDCADLKFIYANHTVWYKNPIGKFVYMISKFADTVTLVSNNEARLVSSALSSELPKNYKVVYLAGRKSQAQPVKRPSNGNIVYCSTSRLVTDKGIKELITAFQTVYQKNSKAWLWLVGDGPEIRNFRLLANDHPHIVFFGHVKNPISYVVASDVFVQPTYHEGLSLSLTEAAMLGKPMIATNVGGNPEVVNKHNGILVPAKNSVALAKAMVQLAGNSELRLRYGKNAHKTYIENFDFDNNVRKQLLPLYD